ncbi:MAG: sigma 54-interacting transcriptional regulator [Terriglobia bacterium]
MAQCVSPSMRAIEAIIADIAPTDVPVLLAGETGTGKEVLALQIHRTSARRHGPFVKVRCSGLSLEEFGRLMQTETRENVGIGNNDFGTVLLDEIGDLDAACQNRLLEMLSLLDTGSSGTRKAHGVISTTCQNLEEEMRTGHFRDELYYRISGVCLRLPPLRQRREDIPVLLEFFISKYSGAFGHAKPQVSPDGLLQFQTYSWPGNVRELENAVRKLVATGDERMALSDLTAGSFRESSGAWTGNGTHSLKEAAKAASRHAERELILKVLTRTRWNRKRAAQELRISYKALLYKLKQIGLEDSGL